KDIVIPEHWPRAFGMDVRWNTVAAIWGALDPATGVLYLYSEYCGEAPPAVHAAAIGSRGNWITGVIDRTGNGREASDGSKLIKSYLDLGVPLQSINSSVQSGILNVSQRMDSGRLKVFASLPQYLEERRLYRRDDKDQIVKDRDNLQDALRCLVNGISNLGTKPVARYGYYSHPVVPKGDRSWMV